MNKAIEIEVAPGELIDKLTILEIKRERIQDAEKRANVELEFALLRSVCEARVRSTTSLLALRAVGVMDARARGLVVQAVLPAKTLVGA